MSPDDFWDLDMPMYEALAELLNRHAEQAENSDRKTRGETTLAAMAAKAKGG